MFNGIGWGVQITGSGLMEMGYNTAHIFEVAIHEVWQVTTMKNFATFSGLVVALLSFSNVVEFGKGAYARVVDMLVSVQRARSQE